MDGGRGSSTESKGREPREGEASQGQPVWKSGATGAAVVLGVLLLGAVVVKKAWVSDDAYITFRCVENFVEGRGLTWNPGERVQVYTHPLWLFLVTGARVFSGELFHTTLVLSFAATLATILVLILGVAASPRTAVLGLAVLALSRAFTDYSTSGLENPLTHLLLVALLFLDRGRCPGFRRRAGFSLVTSLCLLSRPDTLFLVLPAWAVFLWRTRAPKSVAAAALGIAPLVAWEVFALLYYGMPLPNTAYAKLSTGLPRSDLIVQGFHYIRNSILWDPLTLLTCLAAVVVAFARKPDESGIQGKNDRAGRAAVSSRAWGVGIVAHIAFVVWIGGDFMSGRFLTAPLVVAIGLLVSRPLPLRVAWPATAGVLLIMAIPWMSPLGERSYGDDWSAPIDTHGIADERTYYDDTRLFRRETGNSPKPGLRSTAPEAAYLVAVPGGWKMDPLLKHFNRLEVIDVAEEWPPSADADETGRPFDRVIVRGAVGFLGYFVAGEVHILDFYGLGDPFLSHLPVDIPDPMLVELIPRIAKKGWRVGHFYRRPPVGYIRTLATGRNVIRDPDLARYYDAIRRITRDPVFDRERLRTMWEFHTGRYDGLIKGS